MCFVLARFVTSSLQLRGFTVYHDRHGHEGHDSKLERAKPAVGPLGLKLVRTTGYTTSEPGQRWCFTGPPYYEAAPRTVQSTTTSAESQRESCGVVSGCPFCTCSNESWVKTLCEHPAYATCACTNCDNSSSQWLRKEFGVTVGAPRKSLASRSLRS